MNDDGKETGHFDQEAMRALVDQIERVDLPPELISHKGRARVADVLHTAEDIPQSPSLSQIELEQEIAADRGAGERVSGRRQPFIAGRKEQLAAAIRQLTDIGPQLNNVNLVRNWISQGGSSVAFGPSNVAKTFWALDLAFHVAGAADWHGAAVRNGPVVYLAAEGGLMIHNRIEAFRRDRPEIWKQASIWRRMILMSTSIDLCTSGDADVLSEIFTGFNERPSLVIVDTLARSMGGGDENAAQDMNIVIRNIDRIREQTGAHVMVIHHTGKDKDRGMRGSYALYGAVDTVVEISRDGDTITAEQKKQRDTRLGPSFSFKLRDVFIGEDDEGEPVYSAVIDPADAPPRKKRAISGQAAVALQAFGDALAHHGRILTGDLYPPQRQCVAIERWREFCDRHELSAGDTATAKRTAFHKAKTKLQEEGVVRIVDGWAWRVDE